MLEILGLMYLFIDDDDDCPPDKIYLDSNIFIYLILDVEKKADQVQTLLEKITRGRGKALTSKLTLDEVQYAIITNEFGSGAARKIKQNPELIQDVIDDVETATNLILQIKNLTIAEVPNPDEWASVMREYRLLPRDAIHLTSMLKAGIGDIATDDRDFERISKTGIIRVWKTD